MQIYPKEILDFSYEVVHKKHNVNTGILYKVIITLIVLFSIALPFIIVDVSVQSAGIIETHLSQYKIRPQISGIIIDNNMEENVEVKKGDTLLVIETSQLYYRLNLIKSELESKQIYINDLNNLNSGEFKLLSSKKYIEDYQHYRSQYELLNLKIEDNKQKYRREKQLFEKEVISKAEFEEYKFKFKQSKLDLKRLVEQNTNRWTNEHNLYLDEINRNQRELSNLREQIDKSKIISPIDGTINNYKKIEKGSIVFANQQIAEISPNGELIAELFISPKDIGLVKKGLKVQLQVDAFNYNQWGFVDGVLNEISNDVIVVNKTPVFKAKCKLDKDFLVLKNGYVGKLKKGMSLKSRIKITERSLLNLLYDKVDDWVNPNNSI